MTTIASQLSRSSPSGVWKTPTSRRLFAGAGDIIQSRGWGYRIVSEPHAALLSNIRFLAGYRRLWQFPRRDVEVVEAAISEAPTLGAAMRSAGAALDDIPYARAVVLHLLWRRSILCDLTSALANHTALETP